MTENEALAAVDLERRWGRTHPGTTKNMVEPYFDEWDNGLLDEIVDPATDAHCLAVRRRDGFLTRCLWLRDKERALRILYDALKDYRAGKFAALVAPGGASAGDTVGVLPPDLSAILLAVEARKPQPDGGSQPAMMHEIEPNRDEWRDERTGLLLRWRRASQAGGTIRLLFGVGLLVVYYFIGDALLRDGHPWLVGLLAGCALVSWVQMISAVRIVTS